MLSEIKNGKLYLVTGGGTQKQFGAIPRWKEPLSLSNTPDKQGLWLLNVVNDNISKNLPISLGDSLLNIKAIIDSNDDLKESKNERISNYIKHVTDLVFSIKGEKTIPDIIKLPYREYIKKNISDFDEQSRVRFADEFLNILLITQVHIPMINILYEHYFNKESMKCYSEFYKMSNINKMPIIATAEKSLLEVADEYNIDKDKITTSLGLTLYGSTAFIYSEKDLYKALTNFQDTVKVIAKSVMSN